MIKDIIDIRYKRYFVFKFLDFSRIANNTLPRLLRCIIVI